MLKVPKLIHQLDKDHWVWNRHPHFHGYFDCVSFHYYKYFRVNIQKKEDSNISVLMRIMTNYLQVLAAALAYNLQFPTYILDALSSAKQIGNSSGVFLSFD